MSAHRGDERAVITVRVQPRAARTEVVGLYGDAIKIRLRAAPAEGAANNELVRLVAKRLGIPRTAVRIVGGATGRRKRLAVVGVRGDPRDRLLNG